MPSQDETIPSFAWDRHLTVAQIRDRLNRGTPAEQRRLRAWILREATYNEVWQYLTPAQVYEDLPRLEPFLGRRRPFWTYILHKGHELGKV
jgi:hypothetical protein